MPATTSRSERRTDELTTCLICGRDTLSRSAVCYRCQRSGHSTDDDPGLPLEDRYDEESGPDSICNDQSVLDQGLMKIA
jgi:hypothetical protein